MIPVPDDAETSLISMRCDNYDRAGRSAGDGRFAVSRTQPLSPGDGRVPIFTHGAARLAYTNGDMRGSIVQGRLDLTNLV